MVCTSHAQASTATNTHLDVLDIESHRRQGSENLDVGKSIAGVNLDVEDGASNNLRDAASAVAKTNWKWRSTYLRGVVGCLKLGEGGTSFGFNITTNLKNKKGVRGMK
jgi:hypothetical protein